MSAAATTSTDPLLVLIKERHAALTADGLAELAVAKRLIVELRSGEIDPNGDLEGLTTPAIAEALTAAGIPTARGGTWRPSTVHAILDKAKVERRQPVFDLNTILDIVEMRVNDGKSLNEIADWLESEGIPTPKGGRWWPATVRYILERAEEDKRVPKKVRTALSKVAVSPKQKLKVKQSPGEKGKLRVDEDLQDRIVALRNSIDPDSGKEFTMQKIADILNEEGVPTARGGRKWYQTTVLNVLRRAGVA